MTNPGTRPGNHQEPGHVSKPARRQPLPLRLVRGVLDGYRKSQAFLAGLLIGLSIWTPVFVATAVEEAKWQQYGLSGGLAMFGAGVWLRLGRLPRRRRKPQARNPAGASRPGMDRLTA